jgi:peptidase E
MNVRRERIVAIGGGGFQMEGSASPIDDYLLTLTGKTTPRICLLSTASGDRPDYIELFHAAYATRDCEPSHVAFFERDPQHGAVPLSDLEEHLLKQEMKRLSSKEART